MNIATKILPPLPGVYLFKKDNELLYVGKAKSLKKRVNSYFQKKDFNWKIKSLLEEHTHIDHIVTHSETDALLLEAQLIKEHKPKYNVLLKSGQPFVYLLFTKERLPQLELVRNKKQKGTYFGPLLYKAQARNAYHYVLKIFKLKRCNKKIKNGCLDYHIDNCAGYCRDDFDEKTYLFRIQLAMNLLRGQYKQSLKEIEAKVKEYTQSLDFEKAKHLHEYAHNLESIFTTLKARFSETKYDKEVFLATTPIYTKLNEDPNIATQLQQFLNVSKPPVNIDCFDISHFQSRFIVGSCIRFKNGIPDKQNFRRFKIKTLEQQNDYAALQEIVQRRYRNPEELPDLIVIDGGKGQLNAIKDLVSTACISLAKREERVFSSAFPEGVVLDQKSNVGQLLMALRDYAHHFAISYHRKKRHQVNQNQKHV